jgi:DNA-binding GntR family transcriptional regulator
MDGIPRTRLMPLRQPSAPLRHKIVAALRDAIESGSLAPGARLIERDLCERLAVSRTSLREALRALTAEGVVSSAPDRGLMVARPSACDVRNAYAIRAQLESLVVAQFIARADDAERDQLVALGRVLVAAYEGGSVDAILAARHDFQDILCAGARDAVARDIIASLVLKTSALRARSLARPERQRQSIGEINAIVGAILERNVASAQAAASRHVLNAAVSALAVSEPGLSDRSPVPVRTAAALAA